MKRKIINTLTKFIEKESVEKSKGYVFKISMYKKALKAFQNANSPNTYNNAVKILKTVFKNPKSMENKLRMLYNNEFVVNVDPNTTAVLVLSSVPQIGVVKAKSLVQDHGIRTIAMLKKNTDLLNDQQKLGLKYYDDLIDTKTLKAHRIPRSEITKFKGILKKHIGSDSFEICGSYRRKLSHSGDIDVLCTGSKDTYKELISKLTSEGILKDYFSYGSSKWLGMGLIDKLHRRIDLLYVNEEEYPFALMYFTGSKEFNEALRGHAKTMGYTLNEHGLKHIDTKEKVKHNFKSEQDIFNFLNVNYHEPEERIQGKFKIQVNVASSLKANEPKDKIQCLKGVGAGGFSIEQLRNISISKGINPKGKTKKELCDMLFEKNVLNEVALFNVNKGVLLAETFKNGNSPVGYYMSEKYDGIRAVWNGVDLRSRTNKIIHAPQWFLDKLPKEYALDGELYLDHGKFENTTSIVSKKVPITDEWKQIKYMVFDVPSVKKPFEERRKVLTSLKSKVNFLNIVQHVLVKSEDQFKSYYTNIVSQGGEGVMLIDPKSYYEQKRSKYLLKVKPTYDDEAIITNMVEGKGKDIGKLGALVVKKNNVTFKIGTGFNDKLRNQLWKNKNKMKGKLVTFTHKGTTSKGVPRHPAFFRIRFNAKM